MLKLQNASGGGKEGVLMNNFSNVTLQWRSHGYICRMKVLNSHTKKSNGTKTIPTTSSKRCYTSNILLFCRSPYALWVLLTC